MLIGHEVLMTKNTSGGAFFLGKRLVSWTSKKKNCTSQSTIQVEYVVAVVNFSNIFCFKQLLEGMNVEIKDSRSVGTPMSTRHKLSKNDDSKEVDQTIYKSMITKLQYVVHTRPDIALVVGMVAIFLENPII